MLDHEYVKLNETYRLRKRQLEETPEINDVVITTNLHDGDVPGVKFAEQVYFVLEWCNTNVWTVVPPEEMNNILYQQLKPIIQSHMEKLMHHWNVHIYAAVDAGHEFKDLQIHIPVPAVRAHQLEHKRELEKIARGE